MQFDLDFGAPLPATVPFARVAAAKPRGAPVSLPPIPGLEMKRLDRLYFALQPDHAAADAISRLTGESARAGGIKGRIVERARLHLSLHCVAATEGLSSEALAIAQSVGWSITAPAFPIEFDRIERFGKDGVMVLRPRRDQPELKALHEELFEKLRDAGVKVRRAFAPHVTLSYEDKTILPREIAPIRWTAREFVLIHNNYGVSHEVVERWRLSERAGEGKYHDHALRLQELRHGQESDEVA